MTLFTRLFGKAPPAGNGGASAVARSMATPVAPEERDLAGQIAVIGRLGFGEALIAAATEGAAELQGAAQARLVQLIEDGSVSDPEVFAQLAIEGPSTRLRQLAAERIEDPELLRRVLKEARGGKDKNVFKIIKGKCDALNAQQREAEEAHAALIALGESIERHSFKPFDGAFLATLNHLNTQWTAVSGQAPPELQARVAKALERGSAAIDQHLRMVAAQAAQASAIENADAQRQAVLEEMRKQLLAMFTAETVDTAANAAVSAQLARWSERWKDTARYKPAADADVQSFEALQKSVSQLLYSHGKHGTLRQQLDAFKGAPADADLARQAAALREALAARAALTDTEQPQIVTEAQAVVEEWQKARNEKDAAAANAVRQLTNLVRKTGYALDQGKTAQAGGMRRAIVELQSHVPVVPRQVAAQLEQIDLRLGELQDWKTFAVTPKRAQLIERMQALVGSTEPPQALAERIKKLQEEWKSISKGAVQSEGDWEQFHNAAQAAYEPCRQHFAEQARVRQENLEKRKRLTAELVQFETTVDWENPDWREVARRLQRAHQHWRNFNPVERAANKPVEKQFDAIAGQLHAKLDLEYAANTERKHALIQRAQQLLAESDTRKAVDELKRLQSAWKNVGLVPHFEDQKLWESFRQHCDAVYKRSQEAHSQFVAELDAHKAKAVALCVEAEQLAGAADGVLLEGAARLRQLREEFAALGDLPRADANEIRRRFDRALERFDDAVGQQRTRAEGMRWENFFRAGSLVRQVQLALTEGASSDEVEALRAAARDFMASVPQWPKGGQQVVANKLAAAAAGDLAANEAALRLLCIRAEILTETPTPAMDQARRREYQLQILVQGTGRSTAPVREQLEGLAFEWVNVGAAPTSLHDELLERFHQCWLHARGPKAARQADRHGQAR